MEAGAQANNFTPAMPDPLERLPYELWVDCLYFASIGSSDGPLPYLAVSSKWSQSLIVEPTLWTTVHVNDKEDAAARIHAFLHLSGGRLLDIVIHDAVLEHFELIMPHAQRIRALLSDVKFHSNSRRLGKIIELFTRGAPPYPQMVAVTISLSSILSQDQWMKFIETCPNLRTHQGMALPVPTVLSSRLREAQCEFHSLDDIYAVIRQDRFSTLDLPYRTTTADDRQWAEHASHLASGTYPHLKNLNVKLRLRRLNFLPSLLAGLPQLRSLELQLSDYQIFLDNWNPPSISLGEMRKLETLSIICPGDWSLRSFDALSRMLMAEGPLMGLESFTFETGSWDGLNFLQSILLSTPALRELRATLRMRGDISMEQFDQRITLDKLLYLNLDPSVICDYLEAPNVTEVHLTRQILPRLSSPTIGTSVSLLSIIPEIFEHINRDSTPLTIQARWPSLRTLRFVYNNRLPDSQFPVKTTLSLRTLQILDAYSSNLNLDDFMSGLLHVPDACPHLHTIKIYSQPTWELLFEVLRRRNRLNITGIQHLTLPRYPTPVILSILVSLLQGHSEAYSTKDIDEVITRRSEEPTMYFQLS